MDETEHPRPGEEYLTTGEAAVYLSVAIRTVSKYLANGLLTATWYTLGGHARFTKADLDRQREGLRGAKLAQRRAQIARHLREGGK